MSDNEFDFCLSRIREQISVVTKFDFNYQKRKEIHEHKMHIICKTNKAE